VRLGVVRLEFDALAQVLDQLFEIALAVVVAGNRQVDGRVVGLGIAALQIGLFRELVFARVLVDLGELEVVGRFVRRQFDHALDDRFSLGRVGQLVGAVDRDEELQGQRALRIGLFGSFSLASL